MAGSMTDTFEVDLLKAITGQATTILSTTPLTNIYCSLMTTMPTDSTAGTEATGGGYARVQTVGKWGTPASGSVSNTTAVVFGPFSGTVSSGSAFLGFGLHTASSAGTLLAYGTFTDQTKTGGNGDTITLAVGALTITAD